MERGWDIYHIYCDEDYSGADSLRPDFNKMIVAAKEKKFQIILCKSQSRFTRDMELVEKYIHGLFPIWGIRFIAVADNADTEIKGNKKARQINGLINEWYLEDLSENIRMVFDMKRRISRLRLSEGPEEQKPSYYRAGSGGSGAANLSMGAGGPRQAEHRIYAQQQGNRQSHPVQGGTRLELQPSHQERLRIMEQDHSLAHPPQ